MTSELMTGQELARLLEREHRCERCHRRMATEIFDCKFVCHACREALDRELGSRG